LGETGNPELLKAFCYLVSASPARIPSCKIVPISHQTW